MNDFFGHLKRLRNNQNGASAVEYGIIIALISLVTIPVLGQDGLGGTIASAFDTISAAFID